MTQPTGSAIIWIVPIAAVLGVTAAIAVSRMDDEAPAAGSGNESASMEARFAADAALPESTIEQVSELARRQQILAEAFFALEARLDQALKPDASSSLPRSSPAPLTQADLELQDAEVAEQIRQDMLALGNQLAAETADPSWSAGAMDSIRGTAQQPAYAASAVTDLECRATMCRIQAEHESREALESFARGLPLDLQWNATMAFRVVDNADGTQSSTIFVSRDGHDLDY